MGWGFRRWGLKEKRHRSAGYEQETGNEWSGFERRGGVLKIHPTVQTKGGMKKGRGAQDRRESECGGGGQDFRGEKKIVSLSSSPHSHPPLPSPLPNATDIFLPLPFGVVAKILPRKG